MQLTVYDDVLLLRSNGKLEAIGSRTWDPHAQNIFIPIFTPWREPQWYIRMTAYPCTYSTTIAKKDENTKTASNCAVHDQGNWCVHRFNRRMHHTIQRCEIVNGSATRKYFYNLVGLKIVYTLIFRTNMHPKGMPKIHTIDMLARLWSPVTFKWHRRCSPLWVVCLRPWT